jgi:hypothetical protein
MLSLPTDGFGIYESQAPNPPATYQPRLDQIAAGGFKLVVNYSILYGTAAQMTSYINYAASKGLKVIVALQDPRIWRDNTYAATYTALYADAGNPATGTLLMQYVVAQLKGLAGVWGWYVGDEVAEADHTLFKAYTDAIAAADSTHPRLMVLRVRSASGRTELLCVTVLMGLLTTTTRSIARQITTWAR